MIVWKWLLRMVSRPACVTKYATTVKTLTRDLNEYVKTCYCMSTWEVSELGLLGYEEGLIRAIGTSTARKETLVAPENQCNNPQRARKPHVSSDLRLSTSSSRDLPPRKL